MIRLHPRHCATLSFSPDDPVLAMHFDQKERLFVVGVTGAYIDPDVTLEGVRLELTAWTALTIRKHGEEGGLPVIEHLPEELSEICEFEIGDGTIRVAGFLRRAQGYFDLTFQNALLVVECAGQRNVPSCEHTP
ncbi:hypothetical protein [Deinococcus sp. JMULE3]|uniref:hypothetical protein n=1 Tax=Deinococcus sp. JMULE3 TaxID=2518341 RepID=UPI001576B721|nr:hypothetical protein [Deinococcus sp. JMULE3]NTX99854.1 hypothetical protein [Deinococcus sp. JMULE3]